MNIRKLSLGGLVVAAAITLPVAAASSAMAQIRVPDPGGPSVFSPLDNPNGNGQNNKCKPGDPTNNYKKNHQGDKANHDPSSCQPSCDHVATKPVKHGHWVYKNHKWLWVLVLDGNKNQHPGGPNCKPDTHKPGDDKNGHKGDKPDNTPGGSNDKGGSNTPGGNNDKGGSIIPAGV